MINNLGVHLDSKLSFDKQVFETCKASYFHIRALRHIRSPLIPEACKTVAAAIVGSRHDYCTSLLAGTSVSNFARLQLVKNTLARVVAQKSRFCHITPILADLHWLHFKGIALPTAIQSCRPCPTVCAHAITAIFFFLVNMHSLTKNCNGKVQVFVIRCLGHLEWVTMSSFIHFRSSCFQEETQASSFFECLPRYFLSIHWHHV